MEKNLSIPPLLILVKRTSNASCPLHAHTPVLETEVIMGTAVSTGSAQLFPIGWAGGLCQSPVLGNLGCCCPWGRAAIGHSIWGFPTAWTVQREGGKGSGWAGLFFWKAVSSVSQDLFLLLKCQSSFFWFVTYSPDSLIPQCNCSLGSSCWVLC